MNAKGGMDDEEFEKYVKNALVPLFPDFGDVSRKKSIIKVDSGPDYLNVELLASHCVLGFYLHPGVPNTTAVTQEMDQNYGPFKSTFWENLEFLTSTRLNCNMSPIIKPFLIGLLGFGRIDPISKETLPKKCILRGIQWRAVFGVMVKGGSGTFDL